MVFCRVAAGVQGFFVIRWMEPSVLGIWLQLQLITIYGALAHFGLLNAVNRQVPYHRGRDEEERAVHVERVVRGMLLLFMAASLVVLAGMFLAGVGSSPRRRGVIALVFVTVIMLGTDFHLGLFRARHQFGRAGLASVAIASVILIGLPLVYYFGFEGLLWRAALASTTGLLACLALNRRDLSATLDWKATAELLRIGLPIMVVGFGIVAFTSMDRTLIALLLDESAMGQYALCFALAKVLALFPMVIGQIYYPRMTELYAAGGFTRALILRCVQASGLSAAIVGILAGGAFFTMPWVVARFFPKYTAGLPALKVALLAYFVLALAAGPSYFVVSTVQKRRQLVALFLGLVAIVTAGYSLSDQGLVGIAWSLVIGAAVYVAGLWVIVLRSTSAIGVGQP